MNKKPFFKILSGAISILLLGALLCSSVPATNCSSHNNDSQNDSISICSDDDKDKKIFNL